MMPFRRFYKLGLFAALLLLPHVLPERSGAQQLPARQQIEAKLAVPVHAPVGRVTVAALLAALSAQSGVSVRAEDFLQNRIIEAQLDGLTAAQILDAVCELHEWRWFQTQQGSVFVTRKRVVMPREVTQLAVAVQSSFPSDFRRYLGIFHPTQDAYKLSRVNTPAYYQLSEKDRERINKEEVEGIYPPNAANRSHTRLPALLTAREKQLFDSVFSALPLDKEFASSRLTHDQWDWLVVAVLMQELVRLPSITFDLLDGSFRADLFDMSLLDVRIHAHDGLQIGRTTTETINGQPTERFVGGAALIPGLESRHAQLNKP